MIFFGRRSWVARHRCDHCFAVLAACMSPLDLFCGSGGASMGLHRAGFDVTGVDIEPRPSYPFRFVQADALTFDLAGYDLIWASPPCQHFSRATARWFRRGEHPNLIPAVRERLLGCGSAFIIENVDGARYELEDPTLLCGSMFDLRVRRHRLFETSFKVGAPRCSHAKQGPVIGVYGHTGGSSKRDGVSFGRIADWRIAMGINWMNRADLAQAIPPAYSEYLARSLDA